jgi:hypothetical protein
MSGEGKLRKRREPEDGVDDALDLRPSWKKKTFGII